ALVEHLAQRLRLHHVGVQVRTMRDGGDAALEAVRVGVNDEVEPELAYAAVAEGDHLAEFPGRIDMQERERRLCWIERLEREMHQDGGVLADGIEHHRIVGFGNRLANDVDALGLELRKMRELYRCAPAVRNALLNQFCCR